MVDGMINALRNGHQCDEDGVMCIVSRQACHEAADEIEELRAVLRGIVDLGGTMGSTLYAETVDRAARRALNLDKTEG